MAETKGKAVGTSKNNGKSSAQKTASTGAKRGRPPGTKNKKTTVQRLTPEQQRKLEKRLRREQRIHQLILALVLLATSAFLMISLFTQLAGAVGRGISYAVFGLFGNTGAVLPFYFIVYSILLVFGKAGKTGKVRTTLFLSGFFVLISAVYSIGKLGDITQINFGWEWVRGNFTLGVAHNGGGFVGMLTAFVLTKVIGKGGAYIVTVTLMLIAILLTANKPFAWIYDKIEEFKQEKADYKKEHEEELIRELQEESEEEQYQIDMDTLKALEAIPEAEKKNIAEGRKKKIMNYMGVGDSDILKPGEISEAGKPEAAKTSGDGQVKSSVDGQADISKEQAAEISSEKANPLEENSLKGKDGGLINDSDSDKSYGLGGQDYPYSSQFRSGGKKSIFGKGSKAFDKNVNSKKSADKNEPRGLTEEDFQIYDSVMKNSMAGMSEQKSAELAEIIRNGFRASDPLSGEFYDGMSEQKKVNIRENSTHDSAEGLNGLKNESKGSSDNFAAGISGPAVAGAAAAGIAGAVAAGAAGFAEASDALNGAGTAGASHGMAARPAVMRMADDAGAGSAFDKASGNESGIADSENPSQSDPNIKAVPPKREKMDSSLLNNGVKQMGANLSEAATAGAKLQKEEKPYDLPPIELLKGNTKSGKSNEDEELNRKAALLEKTLKSFNVNARVCQVSKGPAVTRFEIQPASGVKVSSIVRLQDDIALNLEARSIRMEAPIPGKAAVGIEIENSDKKAVLLREVIESREFKKSQSKITFAVGRDVSGNPIVANLKDMPHLLIAGSTGSGKSVCINSIIISLLYKSRPDEVKIILVDPKVVELSNYNGVPHLMIPVVNEPSKAAVALNWAVAEMNERYKKFAAQSVRDLAGFNKKAEEDDSLEKMPQIVIIIDELADLMMAAPQQVEDAICRLAQMARAAGMHLIVATQRPSVDIITGVIKANIPSRIAFAVSSQIDSRTILDMAGAEKLVGKGDVLFSPLGTGKPVRVQGTFVSDDEVQSVIKFVSEQGHEQEFSNDLMHTIETSKADFNDDEVDELLRDAIETVVNAEQASVSMLQRKFRIGYNRAARLVDMMEERGIVGPADGSRPRRVMLSKDGLAELDQVGTESEDESSNACTQDGQDAGHDGNVHSENDDPEGDLGNTGSQGNGLNVAEAESEGI